MHDAIEAAKIKAQKSVTACAKPVESFDRSARRHMNTACNSWNNFANGLPAENFRHPTPMMKQP
eukprot:scaffold9571_cov153-Cylindrotheca_fusiformis.AAC.2